MKEKFSKFSLPLLWIFAFIIIIFMITQTVHASSDQDYFPMFQNNNNHFSDYDKTSIENRFDSDNNFIFAYFSGYQAGYGERMKVFHVLVVPKSSGITVYGEKFNNLYQFSLYGGGGTLANNMCYQYSILEQNWKYEYSDSLSSFQNLTSSNYNNSIDYVSNFQIMTNNTSSAQVVLFYDDGVSVPDGDTAREDMEMPDIDDYVPTWTNPPTFDNSTVESSLSSLNDTVKWLGSNIKNTIDGGFKFIGDTVRWGLQKVLDRITDTAQSFLAGIQSKINDVITSIGNKLDVIKDYFSNNGVIGQIKTALTDIKDGVTYLAQPLDTTIVNLAFHSTNFYSLADDYIDFFDNFHDVFDITEPDTFILTINIQNIRTFYNFGCHSPVIIHLDEHFYSIRAALRTFLWVLVSFGTIFVVDKGLANWIRGERNQ